MSYEKTIQIWVAMADLVITRIGKVLLMELVALMGLILLACVTKLIKRIR